MADTRTEEGRHEGSWIALVEVVLVFGAVLAFGFWELYSLRRDEKRADDPPRND